MSRCELLLKIQALQMACIDLNLFLDTHPCDVRALHDFNCYSDQFCAAMKQYECKYGPLEGFGNSTSELPFSWRQSPWPWK
jgi:spore coat protein JB